MKDTSPEKRGQDSTERLPALASCNCITWHLPAQVFVVWSLGPLSPALLLVCPQHFSWDVQVSIFLFSSPQWVHIPSGSRSSTRSARIFQCSLGSTLDASLVHMLFVWHRRRCMRRSFSLLAQCCLPLLCQPAPICPSLLALPSAQPLPLLPLAAAPNPSSLPICYGENSNLQWTCRNHGESPFVPLRCIRGGHCSGKSHKEQYPSSQ